MQFTGTSFISLQESISLAFVLLGLMFSLTLLAFNSWTPAGILLVSTSIADSFLLIKSFVPTMVLT